MSNDSFGSMPSKAWSCSTLVDGVQEAAKLAGLSVAPRDLEQAGWVGVRGVVRSTPSTYMEFNSML